MGCAHSVDAPSSATGSIPRDCEDLAEVDLPDLKKGQSAKSSLAQHRANNLDATRTCQARERERFAKGAS